jgi:hypothetical protein
VNGKNILFRGKEKRKTIQDGSIVAVGIDYLDHEDCSISHIYWEKDAHGNLVIEDHYTEWQQVINRYHERGK